MWSQTFRNIYLVLSNCNLKSDSARNKVYAKIIMTYRSEKMQMFFFGQSDLKRK